MADIKYIKVKTEDEMLTQIKILLGNGYNVAISRDVNILNLQEDNATYTIGYCTKPKDQ
jgi:hypothetical protein